MNTTCIPFRHAMLVFFSLLLGVSAEAQIVYSATKVTELAMPEGDGNNGASVAWNPKTSCYYASFAGNVAFPLAVFNSTGNILNEQEAEFDVRGLWYNKKSKRVEGNAYDGGGIISLFIPIGSNIPSGREEMLADLNPPNANSVGQLDRKGKEILFWSDGAIYRYDRKTGDEKGQISLDTEGDEYNVSTFIYTGKKDKEIGLLDYSEGEIEFFSYKTGKMTAKVRLPYGAPLPDRFNFAYANGLIWLFDTSSRTWMGYEFKD